MKTATRLYLGTIVVLLGVSVGLYLWKAATVESWRERMEDQRASLAEQCRLGLAEQTGGVLRLAAMPLSWAIREPLLRDDLDQVREYFARFVQEPPVNRIVLIGPEGAIAVATDVKLEGQEATTILAGDLLASQKVEVLDRGEADIRLVVPVMSLDRRLGTLVLEYSRDPIDRKLDRLAATGA